MVTNHRLNPFFELYVGERVSEADYVRIFCPVLVKHAEAMFLPGNVVVAGMQGSGKSMLLSLLRPEVRLAYDKAGEEFPVPGNLRRFIGAGINLAQSNAIDFGLRSIRGRGADEADATALYFGDFFNYGVCQNLLTAIEKLATSKSVSAQVGLDYRATKLSKLTQLVSADPVWMGQLAGVNTWEKLLEKFAGRLIAYRDYLHFNSTELDDTIVNTKTSIGMPVAALIKAMKRAEVIDNKTNVFIYVDQFEEIANLRRTNYSYSNEYRQLINRALSRRDPNASFRIGTRANAWSTNQGIYGTKAKVEEERDYKLVDLDKLLRRYENRKTWIFPDFAADVFNRRLAYAGLSSGRKDRRLLDYIFGPGASPSQKAIDYAGSNRTRAVKVDEDWPVLVRNYLRDLVEVDPLSARLGEAWYIQMHSRRGFDLEQFSKAPWDQRPAQYWKKERVEQALFQIAGRCAQRTVWTGASDILELSGGNILIFLSICQHIWSAFLRLSSDEDSIEDLSRIDDGVQALGIFQASNHWIRKVEQETGRSGDRSRFLRWLGEHINRVMLGDRALSNPGHNGFSIAVADLERDPEVDEFLQELSDYGNLIEVPHTTKEKDRKTRLKWYLSPIFCPYFRVPYKRLKEPQYISAETFREWLMAAGVSDGVIATSGSLMRRVNR